MYNSIHVFYYLFIMIVTKKTVIEITLKKITDEV